MISLCLIVKNEGPRLARCLNSARGWVRDIVLVDTGSTDDTLAIARSFGARIFEQPWTHDFSAARNRSLAEAQTPWVLTLDADEVLQVDDGARFEAALSAPGVAAYAVPYHDLRDDGLYTVTPAVRLFRRDVEGMQYRGEVHEQLVAVAGRRVVPRHGDFLHLVHDGHVGPALREGQKLERNVSLSRQMVARRTDDAFAWYCLGQSLVALSEPAAMAEAAEALERARRLLGPGCDEAYAVTLYLSLARLRRLAGKLDEALAVTTEALALFAHSPDLHLLRAALYLAANQPALADADLRACLSPDAATFFVRDDPGATSWSALTQLGLLRVRAGRLAEASEFLEAACALAPEADVFPRLVCARVHLARGQREAAAAVLRPLVERDPNNAEVARAWQEVTTARPGSPGDASR